MKKKYVSIIIICSMIVSLFNCFPPISFSLDDYQCAIGDTNYSTFKEALYASKTGETITILKNIDYSEPIHLINKHLTINLNGYTFNLNNPLGDGLWVDNGSWNLTGLGEFNVTSLWSAVYAYNGSSITVTNATNTADGGFPVVQALGLSSTITVLEDVLAKGNDGKALASYDNAKIEVFRNVTALGNKGQATFSHGGYITVHGDTLTSGTNCFSNYAVNGGNILIKGNAYSSGYGSYTVYSDRVNSKIEVMENVTGTEIGVYCRDSSHVKIHGNIDVTSGRGVIVESSGEVYITGDVSSMDSGVEVYVGTVTVDGRIEANNYITLHGINKSQNDNIKPTTKIGYRTYFHSDETYGDSTVWVAEEPFSGGTGSEDNPYLISNESDLLELARKLNSTNSFKDKNFIQTNDILLTSEWIPIGWNGNYQNSSLPFNGYYNGQGYSISGLSITSGNSWVGLFSLIGYEGVVDNLRLNNVNISGTNYVGAFSGELRGVIKNCTLTGSISGAFAVGGLVGHSYDGLIEDSHSSATVMGSNEFAGGLVGYSFRSYGTTGVSVARSYTNGVVNGNNSVGGLVGELQGGRCIESYSLGTVNSTGRNTGGLIGVVNSANGFIASVENCYSKVDINAPKKSYIGGLIGSNYYATIRNCYSASSINLEGVQNTGGLTGLIYSGSVTIDSYYDSDICGLNDTGKGTPRTTQEMKDLLSYDNWAFPSIWTLSSDNEGYPALIWQGFIHQGLSSDATLSSLLVSGLSLSPVFSSEVNSYGASIANNINEITIDATQTDNKASVTINDIPGNSLNVNLSDGENIIQVKVIAEDKTTNKVYTLNINRLPGSISNNYTYAPIPITVITDEENSSIINSAVLSNYSITNSLTTKVPSSVIDALLKKIDEVGGKEKKDKIKIIFDTIGNISEFESILLKSDLKKIVEKTDSSLIFNTDFITIELDAKALETILNYDDDSEIKISSRRIINDSLSENEHSVIKDRPAYELIVLSGSSLIYDLKGGKAKVLIPYNLGDDENPNSILVYHQDNQGNLKKMISSYIDSRKSVVYITSHFSNFIIAHNHISFKDIPSNAWYKNAVEYLAAREITSGIGNGEFGPNYEMTRAQFVVLLMNAYQLNLSENSEVINIENFLDAGDTYYTNYLLKAKYLGIINGIGQNRFAPDNLITRQEVFVMLYNALKSINEIPTKIIDKEIIEFTDSNLIDSWAVEPISVLVKAGIVNGNNNELSPLQATTRCEMAELLYKLILLK